MLLIENADYFIHLIKLPGSVDSTVTPNDDGTFTMYINAHLWGDQERLIDAWEHEYEHIENDDLYGEKDIEDIECR